MLALQPMQVLPLLCQMVAEVLFRQFHLPEPAKEILLHEYVVA